MKKVTKNEIEYLKTIGNKVYIINWKISVVKMIEIKKIN